jgi:thiol-disulfide isomerase/thioredoxin
MRLLVLALCLLSFSSPLLAASKPTEDELKLIALANLTGARNLYLAGEAASKKGDLETAIWDWSQAIKLKPDSAYTVKCLTQAREQLYKKYRATVSDKSDTKDPLTAYVQASAIVPLLPDNKELAARVDKLKAGLSEDQQKAFTAYQDGRSCMALQDYLGAVKAFSTALTFDRGAACTQNALQQIADLRRSNPDLFPEANTSGERLPQMLFFYTTWCPVSDEQRPVIDGIKKEYQGKLAVIYIDADKNTTAARQYQIDSYPTMIFLDNKGAVVDRMEGGYAKEDLVESIVKTGVQ